MMESYFTPEQQAMLQTRREAAGEGVLRQKQEAWADLMAKVRDAMEAGADPADSSVQALAVQWRLLVRETTGGDAAIERSLRRLWDEQGDALAAEHGSQYDPRPAFDYITKALAVLENRT